ncbi:Rpn family recombination-promoting nuclease/putative transposase [Hydrogenobaculum acidophilum]
MDEKDKIKNAIEKLKNIQSSDNLFKTVFKDKENIKTFLELSYPQIAKYLDFDTLVVLDTEKYNLLESEKRHLDVAFEVKLKDTEESIDLYFILEHKSAPDKDIYLQLLSYIYARFQEVYRKTGKFPNIVPMVVYVGRQDWNLPTSTIENVSLPDELKDIVFRLSFLLHTPKTLSLEQIESIRKDLEIYPYLILMKTIIQELPIKEGLIEIFLHTNGFEIKVLYTTEIKRALSIDFNEISSILSSIPSGGKEVMNILEEALQYGELKGEIKGEIKGKREAIIDILSIRFGEDGLDEIKNRLDGINDLEFVDYLKNQAKKVASLDEFMRLMDKA